MKPWEINIMVIGGWSLIMILAAVFTPGKATIISYLIVLGTAVWVYFDARKLQIQKYEPTFFGEGPVTYGVMVSLFWIIAFPAYISFRQKIKDGKVPYRQPPQPPLSKLFEVTLGIFGVFVFSALVSLLTGTLLN